MSVRLIVAGTLSSPEYATMQRHARLELVPKSQASIVNEACDRGECSYKITRNRAWTADDRTLSLTFMTPAAALLGIGKQVFEAATGAQMDSGRIVREARESMGLTFAALHGTDQCPARQEYTHRFARDRDTLHAEPAAAESLDREEGGDGMHPSHERRG